MKPISAVTILLCFLLCLSVGSCKHKADTEPGYNFKVGLLADQAGFNDRGFNQSALDGLRLAAGELPIYYEAKAGNTAEDYISIVNYFIDNQFNIIITPGYLTADSVIAASSQHPDTRFVLLDVVPEVQPENMVCAIFDVDEASFPYHE